MHLGIGYDPFVAGLEGDGGLPGNSTHSRGRSSVFLVDGNGSFPSEIEG